MGQNSGSKPKPFLIRWILMHVSSLMHLNENNFWASPTYLCFNVTVWADSLQSHSFYFLIVRKFTIIMILRSPEVKFERQFPARWKMICVFNKENLADIPSTRCYCLFLMWDQMFSYLPRNVCRRAKSHKTSPTQVWYLIQSNSYVYIQMNC